MDFNRLFADARQFQFLIGRLETGNSTVTFVYGKQVSIPHR